MFNEAKRFMESAGHTTDFYNEDQIELYAKQFNEDMYAMNEAWLDLQDAIEADDQDRISELRSKLLQDMSRLMWSITGFGYSFGLPMADGMKQMINEVLNLEAPKQGIPTNV
jgi:hypothetical protein